MRRIPTRDCKPGMVLAKPIYNDIGVVLLGKDSILSENLLERLLLWGVETVFINDPRTDDIFVEDVLTDRTKKLALNTIKNTFDDLFKEKLVNKPMVKSNLSTAFKQVMEVILEDMKANRQAMLMLSDIYIRDLYLYTHSLNVALYSVAIGMAKGFNNQQLIELGLGALLHDIGKTKIPRSVLEKKEPLTEDEFELIKKHTIYGFELLRKEHGIPLVSAHCAYQHHEKLSGSGYPRGIIGDQIHEYAKIVAIADVYDAIISERIYKDPKLPHIALEILYTGVEVDFDKELVEIFRKTIAIYPIGTNVTLSSGESGVVVDINSRFPARPIVRILEDKDKNEIIELYEIDLSKDFSKVIVTCGCSKS